LNLYVFCGNDPVNFTDPLGLSTVYIVTKDSEVKLVDPSMQEFRDAITNQKNGTISEIHITGHGSTFFQDIDNESEGLLNLDGRVVFTDNCNSFAEFVRDKLSPTASIYLDGCNTAREYFFKDTENIARQLSRDLPNVSVVGNKGFAIGNELRYLWFFGSSRYIRFGKSSVTAAFPRTYRNGVVK